MILYDQALRLLAQAAQETQPLPEETLPLHQACGRVTTRRICGTEALPAFDNSAMDGYAVKAARTAPAPLRLRVQGAAFAGDAPFKSAGPGAYEITTGAPLPQGCDAVVPRELVEIVEDGRAIEVRKTASPGDYVRPRGRDFPAGAAVVDAATLIEPQHILALAALGIEQVPVRRKPRLALVSTGKEIIPVGTKPKPGQVRNSTGAYIQAWSEQASCELVSSAHVGDDPESFQAAMEPVLAARPDVVLATGAVSVGRHDFVAAAVARLGAQTLYHKVAVRPGKPALAARFPLGPLFFGLPGNPVSTVVGLRFFVWPFLRRLLGLPEEKPLRAVLAAETDKPEGLRCFYKAWLSDGKVKALAGQDSFQIRPLLKANAWLVLPEAASRASQGLAVDVYPL